MRIAILSTIHGYRWAGTEEVWSQFARLALQQGHQVLALVDAQVAEADQCQDLITQGLKLSRRRPPAKGRWRRLLSRGAPAHRDALGFGPDALLVNAGSPFDHWYNPTLRRLIDCFDCTKLFFCHFNSDRLPLPPASEMGSLFAPFHHHCFVSRDNLAQFEVQIGQRLPAAHVILNGSRLILPDPLPFPTSDSLRCASVARLEIDWKGQDLLARILSSPTWRERPVTIHCFGEGPDRERLSNLIALFQCASTMKLAGFSRDIQSLWADHHMLLLPSRGEGTPLAMLEAMMCGRIVVATDVGGVGEILEDGISGYIAEAPTVRSFAAAMERAWQARPLWPAMARNAHARAKSLAGEDPPAARLLKLVESLANPAS
ncbi:MAG: glycosyltransferase family 4 protein [Verrucomicrobiales bacterium]